VRPLLSIARYSSGVSELSLASTNHAIAEHFRVAAVAVSMAATTTSQNSG